MSGLHNTSKILPN